MSNPYVQAAETTRAVLANVQADQMQAATPCASWDVAALINHVVDAQGFFAAGMTGQPPSESQNWAEGDYMAAYDAAVANASAAFAAEGALEQMVQMPFGEMPGAVVMGLATNDTFTHGWDLARATGQSTDLNPELATQIHQQAMKTVPDAYRGDDGQAPFGAEQSCADGACAADQLAAFLGREV
jgi:uncharacterized protein (TIGR03086 family)